MKKKASPEVLKFLKEAASEGGKARASRHSKAKLSEWSKTGGRPRLSEDQLTEAGLRTRRYRDRKKAEQALTMGAQAKKGKRKSK